MPLATDYVTVIQTPSACFADAELAAGQPAMNVLGLPLTYPGAFATVYKMECPGDQAWAVKCFTRHVPDLQERYAAISQHLDRNRRKFAVEFRYLEQGIKIKGVWHPILKMRWVEGFTLNEFLRDRVGNASLLEQLCPLWLRLGYELRASKMAHGDLQHGNVLLVPGSSASAMVLRLIDYDGMWVPELEGSPPGEVGHPNYQHPQRLREGGYNAEIDRFAHLVIYVAFRCLAVGGVALWEKHDNSENLLFKESDFRDPAASKLWPDLFRLPDPAVVTLVAHLLAASQMPLERVPLAVELLAEGKVAPLSGEERDVIRERTPGLRHSKLTSPPPPPPVKPAAPPPPVPVAAAPDWATDATAQPASGRRSRVGARPSPETVPPLPVPEPQVVAAEILPPEAIPVARAAPPVAVVRPQSSPILDVIPVEEPFRPPPLPASAAAATLIQMVDTELDHPPARPKPVPPPLPAKEQLLPIPDWVLGLGLPPDGVVARYWLFFLGGLIAVPLLLGLVFLLVFLLRSSNKPPVVPRPPLLRKTSLQAPRPRNAAPNGAEMQLRGGRDLDLAVPIERPEEEGALRVVLSELPLHVRVGETAVVPAGQGDVTATVRLTASVDVRAGQHKVTVSLYRGTEKLDETTFDLTTVAFVRPEMGDVRAIELTQAGTADVTVTVDRKGNADPLSLSVEPLPKGVTAQALQGAPDRLGLRLSAEADAEVVEGQLVQITLRADGVLAQQKTVSLSVRGGAKGNPGVRLAFLPEATLSGGGQTMVVVRLQRVDHDGPVQVAVEKLPPGVTADAIDVPAGEDQATLTFRSAARNVADKATIDVVARIGDQRAGREKLDLVLKPSDAPQVPMRPMQREPGQPEQVLIPTGDSLKLKATFYPSAEGKKNPCVLMLPDLTFVGRQHREWLRLAAALQKQGCSVLMIDFRGFGENLVSREAVPASFLTPPANALLRPQLLQTLRFNGGRLQTMNQLNGQTVFTQAYLPWLVQDVIAARLWLDLKHDAEEVNTNNLIMIAEGDATALGMIWLALESRRFKTASPGTYESRDLYGAVWLEPRTTLRGMTPAGMKTITTSIQGVKAWPPMLTVYDRAATGEKAAQTWSKTFKQDGKIGGEKGFALVRRFGGTVLAAEGAEVAVTDYVSDLKKNQGLRAWAKRDVEASAYWWDLGNNRNSPAKPAKATRPSLAPLNNWGFTLRSQ